MEIVVLDPDDEPVAIHAMPLRPKLLPLPLKVTQMSRTREQLEKAADEAEAWLSRQAACERYGQPAAHT